MTTDTLPKPLKRRSFTAREVASVTTRKKRQPMREQVQPGMRFGYWQILFGAQSRNGHSHFLCRCVCGKEKSIMGGHLVTQRSTNCGCKKPGKYRHGKTKTRTHRIWQNMRGRCRNPNLPDFKHYGGRGITVCERWNVFENFLADMGECPPGLSIDRIDVNGNYEPGNCRWATQKEQTNNQRKNVRLTLNGRTQTLQQWADELKLDASMIRWRLDEGWSVERALTEPSLKTQRHTVTIDGVTLKLREWSERTGVPYSSIIARYARGLRGQEAVYGGARAR